MFTFISFRDWIQTFLLKFFSWYDFFFTPTSPTTDTIIPNEILTEILLRLPPESLLKCMSVSKSWHQLISSAHFVNTHLKLNTHHRVLFPGINGNFKFCSLPSIFNKQQVTVDMDPPTLSSFVVGSANGLICLCNHRGETYIWNPTISKSKKVLHSPWGTSFYTRFGFGYDETQDDYKALFIDYIADVSNLRTVVNVYSLRTDSWTTCHDQIQDIFLINCSGKFVNGKVYWAASTRLCNYNVHNIIYFDVAEETWGSLELPISGEVNDNFKLGAVGSDLSLIYTCSCLANTSDVWILKNCGLHVSWMKQFTIEYPQNARLHTGSPSINPFSIHLHRSNKGDILLSLPGFILIFGCSTRKLEHTVDVEGCDPAEIYEESMVNPLAISGSGS